MKAGRKPMSLIELEIASLRLVGGGWADPGFKGGTDLLEKVKRFWKENEVGSEKKRPPSYLTEVDYCFLRAGPGV